ncbi:hypothetical protein BG004_003644 [Podila humilis]|nr:hypothetical protein BG004_003644 [Podila humilis]
MITVPAQEIAAFLGNHLDDVLQRTGSSFLSSVAADREFRAGCAIMDVLNAVESVQDSLRTLLGNKDAAAKGRPSELAPSTPSELIAIAQKEESKPVNIGMLEEFLPEVPIEDQVKVGLGWDRAGTTSHPEQGGDRKRRLWHTFTLGSQQADTMDSKQPSTHTNGNASLGAEYSTNANGILNGSKEAGSAQAKDENEEEEEELEEWEIEAEKRFQDSDDDSASPSLPIKGPAPFKKTPAPVTPIVVSAALVKKVNPIETRSITPSTTPTSRSKVNSPLEQSPVQSPTADPDQFKRRRKIGVEYEYFTACGFPWPSLDKSENSSIQDNVAVAPSLENTSTSTTAASVEARSLEYSIGVVNPTKVPSLEKDGEDANFSSTVSAEAPTQDQNRQGSETLSKGVLQCRGATENQGGFANTIHAVCDVASEDDENMESEPTSSIHAGETMSNSSNVTTIGVHTKGINRAISENTFLNTNDNVARKEDFVDSTSSVQKLPTVMVIDLEQDESDDDDVVVMAVVPRKRPALEEVTDERRTAVLNKTRFKNRTEIPMMTLHGTGTQCNPLEIDEPIDELSLSLCQERRHSQEQSQPSESPRSESSKMVTMEPRRWKRPSPFGLDSKASPERAKPKWRI